MTTEDEEWQAKFDCSMAKSKELDRKIRALEEEARKIPTPDIPPYMTYTLWAPILQDLLNRVAALEAKLKDK